MDVHSKTSSLIFRSLILLLIFSAAALWLLRASKSPTSAGTQERVFENTIPKDAPSKIKIKKEKERSFKDLKNEKWVREFELEVVNTSDKPILFLYLHLITDVDVGGDPLMFSLVYGRPELGDIVTKAGPDDIPINPGETYVFKIHSGQVPAWEMSLREKSHNDAARIKARLEVLSFGDGTGYFLNKIYSRPDSRQSILDRHKLRPSNKSGPKGQWPTIAERAKQIQTSSNIQLPVAFVPANFLPPGSADLSRSAEAMDVTLSNVLVDANLR